ncbi:MAG: hypothetical protein H6713_02890 [Myxococcales bacterium]|nr:hypothetical protein [Myxococcales bacterium]
MTDAPRHDEDDLLDTVLDTLIEDASWTIEQEQEQDEDELTPPPFTAIIARAHRLDPNVVPRAWVPEEHTDAPELLEPDDLEDDLPLPDLPLPDRDDPLARFIVDARAEAEHDIRSHIALVGDAPALTPRPRPRRARRLGAVFGLLAAAAATVLFFAQLAAPDATLRLESGQRFFQSVVDLTLGRGAHEGTARPVEQRADEDAPPPATSRARRRARRDATERDDDALDDAIDDAIDDGLGEAERLDAALLEALEDPPLEELVSSDPAPREPLCPDGDDAPTLEEEVDEDDVEAVEVELESPRPRSLREQLAALDDDAEAALRAGELDAADAVYREIIRRGGRHRLVELAYGDRIALARRAGDRERRVALWREYLQRFPRGRFAEDARAGLCRVAEHGRADCWRDYLTRYPEGTYAALARRAIDSAEHP